MTAPTVECKRCHATIRWLRTENGRAMPVDADPDESGNVVLRDGYAHVLRKDEPKPANTALLMPHFATCGKQPKEPTHDNDRSAVRGVEDPG